MTYAGFWRRCASAFIDGLIIAIPSWGLNYFIPYAGGFVIGFLYYPLFYSSPLQATPGKALMGMGVLSESGQTLTLKAAIIRHACTFVSAICLMAGYLMNLFTAKRQTFHDMVAASVVVIQNPPEVNYFHIWLTEIKKLGGQIPPETQSVFNHTPNLNAAKAIEDLHKLFQSGAITQAEFETKKTELLNKI